MIEPHFKIQQDLSKISKQDSGSQTKNAVIDFDPSKRSTTARKMQTSISHPSTFSSSEPSILSYEGFSEKSTFNQIKEKHLISNKDIPMQNPERIFKRTIHEKIPIENTNSLEPCNIFADCGIMNKKKTIF